MCLQWQVAIVHNVLMLTKCQFDPWDRRVGRGCGSWILKRATARCSCGDDRRHDTDETSNYLPNGRQIQGGREGGGREMKREDDSRKDRWWREKGTKGRCDVHFSLQVSVIGQMKVSGKRFCHFGLKVTSRVTLQSSHSNTVAELHPGELTHWPLTCGAELLPDFVWSHKTEKPDSAGSVSAKNPDFV